RRHTRFSRDWSSDVCSSDLVDKRYIEFIRDVAQITMDAANPRDPFTGNKVIGEKGMTLGLNEKGEVIVTGIIVGRNQGIEVGRKIGRASCRERVYTKGDPIY